MRRGKNAAREQVSIPIGRWWLPRLMRDNAVCTSSKRINAFAPPDSRYDGDLPSPAALIRHNRRSRRFICRPVWETKGSRSWVAARRRCDGAGAPLLGRSPCGITTLCGNGVAFYCGFFGRARSKSGGRCLRRTHSRNTHRIRRRCAFPRFFTESVRFGSIPAREISEQVLSQKAWRGLAGSSSLF